MDRREVYVLNKSPAYSLSDAFSDRANSRKEQLI